MLIKRNFSIYPIALLALITLSCSGEYRWEVVNNFDHIYAITADDSCIWMATRQGLIKIDGKTRKVFPYKRWQLEQDFPTAMCIGKKGHIWIGTKHGFLERFDGKTWKKYITRQKGLPSNRVLSLYVDKRDWIWVGTGNEFEGFGLSVFDGKNWKNYNTDNSDIPGNFISTISGDKQNTMYMGVGLSKEETIGLVDNKDSKWLLYEKNRLLKDGLISNIVIDRDHFKWIAINGLGLAKIIKKEIKIFTKENSPLPTEDVISVAIDKKNNKWIATHKGICKFDDANWTIFNIFNSELLDNYINPIVVDDNDYVWAGTCDRGLAVYDGHGWRSYQTSNSDIPDNTITAIKIIRDIKWIGTRHGGLAKFDGKRWDAYNTENSDIPDNFVKHLAIDSKGNIWIGTNNGLAKYDGVKWIVFNSNDDGQYLDAINVLAVDKNEKIWIGKNGSGLLCFNGEEWLSYDNMNSNLPSDNIKTINIANSGSIWIGTEKGILNIHDSIWTVFTKNNGKLVDEDIESSFIDMDNNYWFSSNNKVYICEVKNEKKDFIKKFEFYDIDLLFMSGVDRNNIWYLTTKWVMHNERRTTVAHMADCTIFCYFMHKNSIYGYSEKSLYKLKK